MPIMSPNPPTLAETQALLWTLITAPENVHRTLQERSDVDLPIMGDERLSPVDRLNIYANMYFFRILDSLKEDFPSLVRILGDEGFHNLITEYLQAHPPSHYSLRYAGEHLANFVIARSAANVDGKLADLARFEWALLTAFDAADASSVLAEDLQEIPPEEWGNLRFSLHPSCQLLTMNFDVLAVYDHLLEAPLPDLPARKESYIRVWRQGLQVMQMAMTADEFQMLTLIAEGKTLAEVLSLRGREAPVQNGRSGLLRSARNGNVATQFTHFLQTWLSHGLLCQPAIS